MTFGGFLMLGGRAADLFGRRRVFVAGLALFSAASLAGGFARAPWALVAARAVQGIGGAVVSPAALSLLTTTFSEGPARNRAMGWFGTMSTIGFAVGMMLGGVLTHAAGWPWVMFVNVPVGLAVILLAPLALPPGRGTPPAVGFDLLGAVLVTGASSALVYALSDAAEAGWGAPRPWRCWPRRRRCSSASSRRRAGCDTRWCPCRSSAAATSWGPTSSGPCWRRRRRRWSTC